MIVFCFTVGILNLIKGRDVDPLYKLLKKIDPEFIAKQENRDPKKLKRHEFKAFMYFLLGILAIYSVMQSPLISDLLK
jgi:hypothetical protein